MNAAAGIATVAAFFPDDFELRLCDEIVEPVDYDDPAEVIAISVNIAQAAGAAIIARRFRAMGRTVILGGAHVSLAPDIFEGVADCLVLGEFEQIADDVVADIADGTLKRRYQGGKADLGNARMPRWDLYPNELALAGVVQTSRGCPFDCNFCDVIQYLGRVQRHKPPELVIHEVQALYDLGYRQINLSDDNFTVYRQRTLVLLEALAAWNGADGRDPVSFMTQMSIDVARHPELLAACNRAGLRFGFVGLETSNIEALKESRKRQNMRIDLVEQCEKVVRAGVSLQAGLMIGFDSDDLSCFERQFDFAMALPIVVYRLSVLVAPIATPLYDQMRAAGRIVEEPSLVPVTSGSSLTNIQPAQMSREQLGEGAEWLRHALLDPGNAIGRFERYAQLLGDMPEHLTQPDRRDPAARSHPFMELFSVMARDPAARRVIDCVRDLAATRPTLRGDLMQALGLYLNSYARQPRKADLPRMSAVAS
ncbi:B12-binding domain-containing radical SAM protein [Meridianimarinicoccus sp. RP-17]|uniref:B12-binding domain-containing radical SAM protein n=1 Tax=Meridianimarinicoccus zhengii TaxID=2056810 RepID=UPI0013A7045E|nr:radical SAM protein [Phycocomes zhengii]